MHNDVKINGSNFVSIWSRLSASCSKQNFFNSWDSIAVVTFKWVTKHQNVCDGLGLIQSIMWQWAMKVQTFIYIFKQHEISSLDISSTNVPHLEALTNNSQHLKCESGMTPFKTIGEYPMPPLISCETTVIARYIYWNIGQYRRDIEICWQGLVLKIFHLKYMLASAQKKIVHGIVHFIGSKYGSDSSYGSDSRTEYRRLSVFWVEYLVFSFNISLQCSRWFSFVLFFQFCRRVV